MPSGVILFVLLQVSKKHEIEPDLYGAPGGGEARWCGGVAAGVAAAGMRRPDEFRWSGFVWRDPKFFCNVFVPGVCLFVFFCYCLL